MKSRDHWRRIWGPGGVLATGDNGLLAGLVVMFGIKAIGMLRISEEGELEGRDIHEHGAPAYQPEPSYEGYSPLPSRSFGGGEQRLLATQRSLFAGKTWSREARTSVRASRISVVSLIARRRS